MVKKSGDNSSNGLTWKWKTEPKKDTMNGKGNIKVHQLLEKKELTLDAIDYLCATVGIANYGASFDEIKMGILGGHVQLVEKNNVTMDFSNNLGSYMVGLNGEKKRLYDLQPHVSVSWNTNSPHIPIRKLITWYKAEFKAPFGTNSIVVGFQGLGKGHAWVNGHNIDRYWASWVTTTNGYNDI
ncbi:hypothetical protein KIW84_055938 [Lathyrus oleraceus]|uniref:Beta-galactosidase galactose-binding domain-containing protein n=1 Tax=Pisum sativum TaxID=3888 RepID=A0A9D4WWX1_PEA|nr:hypothetical protein KIW84_055938 [Pisum sativum]